MFQEPELEILVLSEKGREREREFNGKKSNNKNRSPLLRVGELIQCPAVLLANRRRRQTDQFKQSETQGVTFRTVASRRPENCARRLLLRVTTLLVWPNIVAKMCVCV